VEGTVNVIMHGVFGYVLKPGEYIEAYTPAVHGHIYRAGGLKYDDAKPLRHGINYTLKGVQGDPKARRKPDCEHHPIVERKIDPIDEYKKRYCMIRLPYPPRLESSDNESQIYPVDAFELGEIYAGQHVGTLNDMEQCPSLLVFVYPRNHEKLELIADDLSCPIEFETNAVNADVAITNAHIWCTIGPKDLGHSGMSRDAHTRRAFNALVDLFPALDLRLQYPDRIAPTACAEHRPPGVSRCDIDPGREGCIKSDVGKVNCHYSNLIFWPPGEADGAT